MLQSRVSFLATIGTLLASIAFFVADSPGGLKGGTPTINWKCRNTPAPFWTLTACMCPVSGVPQDFCINQIPPDGSENVEVRYCEFTGDPADDCDFTQVLHCGGVVYKCLNAHCSTAPSYPLPSTWNCSNTHKPYDAYCFGSMPWCAPVD